MNNPFGNLFAGVIDLEPASAWAHLSAGAAITAPSLHQEERLARRNARGGGEAVRAHQRPSTRVCRAHEVVQCREAD